MALRIRNAAKLMYQTHPPTHLTPGRLQTDRWCAVCVDSTDSTMEQESDVSLELRFREDPNTKHRNIRDYHRHIEIMARAWDCCKCIAPGIEVDSNTLEGGRRTTESSLRAVALESGKGEREDRRRPGQSLVVGRSRFTFSQVSSGRTVIYLPAIIWFGLF